MAFLRTPLIRTLLNRAATAAALATALIAAPAHAGTTQLVTLVVPAAPGGSNDILARVMEPLLRGELDRPVVVENRGGGGGNVGAAYVARAEAGSNIWLLTSASIITMNPGLFAKPGFDTLRDFVPVAGIASVPHVLLVNKDFAPSNLPELLAALRKEPDTHFFGSAGNGTYSHILMEFLKRAENVDVSHVPFRGVAPAMTELMAGRIQMLISTLPSAMPYLQSRDVKALAVFSEQRSEFLPELPLARDTVPGLVGDLWIALYAPKTTAAQDVERMRQAVEKAQASAELREKFRKMGASIYAPTAGDLSQQTSADLKRWSQLIQQAGIQVDQEIGDSMKLVRFGPEGQERSSLLEPGDLIITGTPAGVGMGMKPPRYLKAGDVMELGIEGLGVQRQRVVQALNPPASHAAPAS